ncbi:MAG: hypothetical protein IPO90_08560 [Flavobacteriales bacterium]|nr:hypothetical protein [Flavobacteriales bacterium]
MDINFEEVSKGQTLVRCLIGPTPGIWTLFAAGYVRFSLLGTHGPHLGFRSAFIATRRLGVWAVPFALLAMAFMFSIERTGRARAQDDMRLLEGFPWIKRSGATVLKLADAFAPLTRA